ncbi:MAG: type IV secretory system conjugative DNA transfer family protein, partial [Verrucomicrobiales bacterium]
SDVRQFTAIEQATIQSLAALGVRFGVAATADLDMNFAAMSRADVPEKERSDFFLYVDEFQSFVSDSFATILSEARKYRLCLTLSHQYVDQLKPEIAAAIIGNVGSLVSFRVGHRDAKALEQAFGETYPATHFTGMNNYEICAKVLSGGKDLDPFVGWTHPPAGKRHGRGATIIRRSRQKYSTVRTIVERRIHAWMRIQKR